MSQDMFSKRNVGKRFNSTKVSSSQIQEICRCGNATHYTDKKAEPAAAWSVKVIIFLKTTQFNSCSQTCQVNSQMANSRNDTSYKHK